MKTSEIHLRFLTTEGICTDTRKLFPKCCFVALTGENFDGNNFVQQALEAGASLVICETKVTIENQKLIKVDSPLTCLQELARFHRTTFNFPIISITGSNGKTTSKELIRDVLKKKGKTGATIGNLNNHIGVPLTLLSFPQDLCAGIVEMGANHQKEIEFLSSIAQPDYVYITNIGKAHLEGFGGVEGVKKGKKELFDYAEQGNKTAFVQMSDPVITDIAKGIKKQIKFGSPDHLPCAKPSTKDGLLSIDFQFSDGNYQCQTQLSGEYNMGNALAAAAIGQYFAVPPLEIIEAIAAYKPANNRSELRKGKYNQVILDAYNANPTSMLNALKYLHSNFSENGIAVIGDMLEMGEESAQEHLAILEFLSSNSMEAVLVGNEFMTANVRGTYPCFENAQKAYDFLERSPIKNKTVLLKGSRGIALEKLLPLL
ncbi:MAG: UDP-N-acetylmuramoyl-tripeptide--D-alanyl-D-alanine ligase [Flavobacteriales bacterium]